MNEESEKKLFSASVAQTQLKCSQHNQQLKTIIGIPAAKKIILSLTDKLGIKIIAFFYMFFS